MKLYYREFLMFAGETNASIREKLEMDSGKAGVKEFYVAGRTLRAFVLSRMEFSRIHHLEEDDKLESKLIDLEKTMCREEYSHYPLGISERRRNYLLKHSGEYRDLLFPDDNEAWQRIKRFGDDSKFSMLWMNAKPIFDSEELFLSKEDYVRLFEVAYRSAMENK